MFVTSFIVVYYRKTNALKQITQWTQVSPLPRSIRGHWCAMNHPIPSTHSEPHPFHITTIPPFTHDPLNTKIIHMKASSMEFNTFHMQDRTSLKFWSNGWVVMRTGKVINGSPRLWIHTEVVVLRWSLCWWTWTRGWYGGYDDWAVHFRIPYAYPEWTEDWQICPEYTVGCPTLQNG